MNGCGILVGKTVEETLAGLGVGWLPDMDLNHDKQIQSLLCYRYTIGQAGSGREASQVRF